MPISISLESLRIANATIDVMQDTGPRFPLAFARHFGAEPAAQAAAFVTSDAVIVGQDLIGSLQSMAVHFTVTPAEAISPALRRVVADLQLRAALDRAFVATCQSVLPLKARAMIVNAWHDLLTAFLASLDIS